VTINLGGVEEGKLELNGCADIPASLMLGIHRRMHTLISGGMGNEKRSSASVGWDHRYNVSLLQAGDLRGSLSGHRTSKECLMHVCMGGWEMLKVMPLFA